MIGPIPPRPSGSSAAARFFQWLWDNSTRTQTIGQSRGAKISRTVQGTFIEPLGGEGTGNSRARQYLLTDASHGDYFICRTLAVDVSDPDNPVRTIGSDDVYIAKPFHLRQSPFDRAVLNAAAPGNIGTVNEITYDIQVETPDIETHNLSHAYVSATFRVVTDETDANPLSWVTENQTVVPRFVPAVLVESEEGPPTTDTISPTIICAAQCSNLGLTRPDDPDLPEDEQTPVSVTLLALADCWAWMQISDEDD